MNPPKEDDLLEHARESKAFKRLEQKLGVDTLWLWILKLLKEEPRYAYELKDLLDDRFSLSPATVTIYTVLYLLERENIVERVEQSGPGIRIDRKYYGVTELGNKIYQEAGKYLNEIQQKLFLEADE